ncbi:MAG: hypothetical protein D6753_08290 [Planctomycetota bacterium]|nr:MAG: hypothetical protein D6753_08290 [Planctomycetota bacterium]
MEKEIGMNGRRKWRMAQRDSLSAAGRWLGSWSLLCAGVGWRSIQWMVIAACALAGGVPRAHAGLSSAETVVVVNGDSFQSRTVANHYVYLRNIPPQNVIVLRDVPNSEEIDADTFRQRILSPLLLELDARKLAPTVQCIAYSADFPTAIDISKDLQGLDNLHKVFTRKASITGLTYLYLIARQANPAYILPDINFYARQEIERYFSNPGGNATREAWQEVQRHIADERHREAAESIVALLDEQPYQFPLAYLAAAEYAQAGDNAASLRLLGQAVENGWVAGGYLQRDTRFDALRGDPEFQVLSLLLDEQIDHRQWPHGFDARTGWATNGVPIRADDPQTRASLVQRFGMRYLLCTVLAVTRGNGLKLPEAIDMLHRSAAADFSHPAGKFLFCETDDVRSRTRARHFPLAVEWLKQMGYEAEIVRNELPRDEPRVAGVQLGTPHFDWPGSGSRLVPGAVAENLTSLGGVMRLGAGQTKLTELLRGGAAGSSGTVVEPYAIESKFPTPFLYVYYAQGASLAEAFYLSVSGPYQLLIVGDPLCRPFSHAPHPILADDVQEDLPVVTPESPLVLSLDLSGPSYATWDEIEDVPLARRTRHLAPAELVLLRDGELVHTGPAVETINVEARGMPAGYHRLDIVAAADDPLAQKHSIAVPFWVGQPEPCRIELPESTEIRPGSRASIRSRGSGELPHHRAPMDAQVSLQQDRKLRIAAQGPADARRIAVWRDAEQLVVGEGAKARFEIDVARLGLGPVRLQPQAEMGDGSIVRGRPYWIDIVP